MKFYINKIVLNIICILSIHFNSLAQIITTVAGNGIRGYSGDGGQAITSQLNQPLALALDDSENIYIVDVGNNNIRKVSSRGIISTYAGTGFCGYSGNGGLAVSATVCKPHGIVTDDSGNIYFPEYGNCIIREISKSGIISTIAGIVGEGGNYYQDTIESASSAKFGKLNGIAIDKFGNIYFADENNNRIAKILTNGIIMSIAGNSIRGYSGDGGPAIDAELNNPYGIALDTLGNIYFADTKNNVVRKISINGIITTIAGTGDRGYFGDGGLATKAKLDEPMGIATDHSGNIYIADWGNNVIRIVNSDGIISRFAGNGHKGYSGDGKLAIAAQLNEPCDVAVGKNGNIYIADDQNHVVRKIMVTQHPKKVPPAKKILKAHVPPSDAFIISVNQDQEELIITIDSGAYTSFTITDSSEKVFIQQQIKTIKTYVNVSSLLPRLYYINLKRDDAIKSRMFVKDQ